MPELASPVTQSVYTYYLIDIYRHWNEYPNARRGTLFDGAIRQVLRQCALPEPALRWAPGGGSFNWMNWSLTADQSLLNADLNRMSTRDWVNLAIYQYHEARHLEQFWLMALGMLSGGVAIPTGPRGRGVMPGNATVQARAETLNRDLGYPQVILLQAVPRRRSFRQAWIPTVRAWVDSVFGRGSRARGQTLNHLRHLGHKSMAPYISLPEEADAWAVERSVKNLFRQRIGAIEYDEALEGVARLFGDD